MKKVGIIIIIIAVLLIIGGVVVNFVVTSINNGQVEEDRNYSQVEEVTPDTLSQTSSPDTFVSLAEQIGFADASCEATDAVTSSELCIASHHGYTNSDFTDYLTITYQNKAINTLEVSIYFSADDFVIQNIQKQTNLVLSNFFGTELTEEQVTEQYNSLQNSKDKDEPVAVNQLQIGSYTAEINMQYIQDQDFYLVHYFLVPTEQYES